MALDLHELPVFWSLFFETNNNFYNGSGSSRIARFLVAFYGHHLHNQAKHVVHS